MLHLNLHSVPVKILSILVLLVGFFTLGTSSVSAAAYIWDGGGATENWSDCDNWSSNICPVAADTLTFNSTSTKNSSIDSSWTGSITSINIASGYSGTITMQRSLTVGSSGFTQSTGIFTATNQVLDINGGLQLNSGANFTASSDTTSVSGNATVNSGATFNHNNGTINFDGNQNITCNGAVFNLVVLSVSTKSIASGCNLPLGNNPTVVGAIGLSGTLSGSGTYNMTGSAVLTLNAGAVLDGFTGMTVPSLTVNGAIVDLSSYSPVTINSNTGFTLNSGTFTAPTGVMTVTTGFTINGGTFNHNGGTLNFNPTGAQALSCNGATFNLVTLNLQGGTTTVGSNCTLPLGNNPTITGATGSVVLNGTVTGTGTLTRSAAGAIITVNSTGSISGFSAYNLGGLTIAGANLDLSGTTFSAGGTVSLSSGTLTLPNGADLNSSLSISGGTFNAPSGNMTLAGALTITGSPTFNHNNGSITMDGSAAAWSCGNVTFNLVVDGHTSGAKTIQSNCNLPLGNNPAVNNIVLNGTLSGTGNLTMASNFQMNSGSALSGFSGINRTTAGASLIVAGATLDLSSYSPVNSGSFTLSSGTFTAPANMDLTSNLTISGGTFNHNNGTITFTGNAAGTLNCGGATFNLVQFSGSAGVTKTVNSNCTIPLGNNPVITNAINLSGTFSGTGTVNFNSNGNTMSAGATLSGFTAVNTLATTIAGATMDLSGLTSYTNNNTLAVNSGSLTLPNTTTISGAVSVAGGSLSLAGSTDLNSSLSISSGSFTAPSSTMTLAGALTITGSPTFNANGGTIIFDGGGATLSCNNVTFNLIAFNHTGLKTVNSNCNLPLGNNPSLPFSITLNGTLSGSGVLTVHSIPSNSTTLTLNATSSLSAFSGISFIDSSGTLTLNGGNLDASSYSLVDLNRLTINSGTFTAPSIPITVSGNLNNIAGTFIHNNGTVILDSPGPLQRIDSDFTFNNLSSEVSTARVLSFAGNTTQTILGMLTLNGTGGTLSLTSLTSGVQWNIDAQGPRVLNNLFVQDSNNINSQVMFANNSTDGGNNTNWFFSDGSAPTLSIVGPQDTSYINNQRPGFKWQAATTTAGTNIDHYVLQMNNGATDGNWELLDIPAYWGGTYVTSKYIAAYEGFDDEDPNNNYITVTTQSSTDWGPMENDGLVAEGAHTWSVTVFDTLGNATIQSKNILTDLTGPTTNLTLVPNSTFSNNQYTTNLTQPILFGTSQDALNGTPIEDTIASGPQTVTVYFNRQIIGNVYLPYTTATTTVSELFWTADNSQVNDNFQNTSAKYSPFSVAPPVPLLPGTYQVTMVTNDLAGNTGGPTTFIIQIGSSGVVSRVRNITQPPLISPVPTSQTSTPSPSPTTTVTQPTPSESVPTESLGESPNESWFSRLRNTINSWF